MARVEVRTEMAGTVKELLVAVGDPAAEAQELLILESMKMEVPVESPATGRVAELCVEAGAVIAEGDLLLVLEAG